MNKVQWRVLTIGLVLWAWSCLFPLWRPASDDFTYLFRPPQLASPDAPRMVLEWFFLSVLTVLGLVLTRKRIPTVYPIHPKPEVLEPIPADMKKRWESAKRRKKTPLR